MAYNSDGYIMIDFTEVDFRRTNQTIEGLFERCQKVIGTNKFVIVINANHKTPLPSTVCITNGQYVIESVLYTFSISSNDNLHITKKTTPEELIDDNHVTLKTTFSSNKIMSLFGGIVKSFTYVGDGNLSHDITFPEKPNIILLITGKTATNRFSSIPCAYGCDLMGSITLYYTYNSNPIIRQAGVTYNDNIITLESYQAIYALNGSSIEYTVYYI